MPARHHHPPACTAKAPLPLPERLNILGTGVSVINPASALELLQERARSGHGGYVNVLTVASIIEALDDPKLRAIFNRSFLGTPDGMPLSWVGWARGEKRIHRVYGPDLLLSVMNATRDGSLSHYFYGGREGVAVDLQSAMNRRFPGVRILGAATPPFRPLSEAEAASLADEFRRLQVHFIWIGISTPKQDFLMEQLLRHYPFGVFLGVGAAFDFHTGRVRQAPSWMQQAGLEWFFRLTQEPARLWKRYLVSNPRFLWGLLVQSLGWKKFPLT